MRTLGRLAMAAALIVPVGAVGLASITTAGASPNGAHCTAADGVVKSKLGKNGVNGPGLTLFKKNPQQFGLKVTDLACTGGFVTGGSILAKITTKTPTNCQTIANTTLGGNGTLSWTDAGFTKSPTNFSIHWRWTGATTIHFSGGVSNANSRTNVFKRDKLSGNITTTQSLKSTNSGGSCSADAPLTQFDITSIGLQLHPTP